LAAASVMVLLIRNRRVSLEPRQALLALGLLALVQGLKLWLGAAASPLALLVPPTLLLAQGLGTTAGLAWLAMASLLWPLPLSPFFDQRILIAAAVAAITAVLADRQRNRAQLLQLALLVPLGALLAEWLLLQLELFRGVREGGLPIGADLTGEALVLGGLLLGVLYPRQVDIIEVLQVFEALLFTVELIQSTDRDRVSWVDLEHTAVAVDRPLTLSKVLKLKLSKLGVGLELVDRVRPRDEEGLIDRAELIPAPLLTIEELKREERVYAALI